jgi:hypothetical protein
MGVILPESGANPAQIRRKSGANLTHMVGKSQATDSRRRCDMQRTDVAREDRATRDVTFGPLCTRAQPSVGR